MRADTALEVVRCPSHGAMKQRQPGTREQAWCGVWWQCEACSYSVLFPSVDLVESLRAAEARLMKESLPGA